MRQIIIQVVKSVWYLFWRLFIPWRERSRAIVLVYHSIGNEHDLFTVSPEEFEWQMIEIQRHNCRAVSLRELENMLAMGNVPPRTVVITFDDGRKDNYEYAFPILKKFNMPAAIFVATSYIGSFFEYGGRVITLMSQDEILDMHTSGLIDFEPHTATHRTLAGLPEDEVRSEVLASKEALEKLLRKECPYFAYPKGKVDAGAARDVASCGIRLAFGTKNGAVTPASDRLALPRNGIDARTTHAHFKGILAHGRIR